MTYKCGICKKEMTSVDNIKLKEFLVKGWRCECGQTYSDLEDVSNIVMYLRTLSISNTERLINLDIPEEEINDEERIFRIAQIHSYSTIYEVRLSIS